MSEQKEYDVRLLLADAVVTVKASSPEEAKNIAYDQFHDKHPDIEVYETQIDDD